MKKLLSVNEQHYADTAAEAEEIVTEAKQDDGLVMHRITGKHNKYGSYQLVDLKFSYHTPRDLMAEQEKQNEKVEDEK